MQEVTDLLRRGTRAVIILTIVAYLLIQFAAEIAQMG
jgi:hypothetical protein